jgi:hypothetical protein
MNFIRITGAAFLLALPLVSVGCSSSNSGSNGSHEGGSTEDGGSPADSGAGESKPVSTCKASDEGAGCHDTSCPCTLLTQDQIKSALGVTVGAPDNGTGKNGDPHNCIWTYEASSTDKVTVYLTTNIEPPSFEGTCGGKPSNGVTTTAVSGVGDTACYTVIAEGLGTDLNFQKNCWAYTISISATGTLMSMFTKDTIEADEKTLAQGVASKY